MRSLITRILRRGGYRVTEAHDKDEALLALEREPFDLVLLEMSMHGIEEMTTGVRGLQPSTRIVGVGTPPGGPRDARVRVVPAPFTPKSLLEGVRSALHRAG
jgi:DNA-binding NtrC family response regulator